MRSLRLRRLRPFPEPAADHHGGPLISLGPVLVRPHVRVPALLTRLDRVRHGWTPPPRPATAAGRVVALHISDGAPPDPQARVVASERAGGFTVSSPFWSLSWAPRSATATLRLRPPPRNYVAEDGLRAGLRVLLALELLWRRGAALHGAAVVRDGHAVVALGPKEAGKTTFASHFPWDRVLADDLAALHPHRGELVAQGTPFRGREGLLGEVSRAPVSLVVVLSKAPRTTVRPLTRSAAVGALLARTHAPGGALAFRQRALAFALRMTATVPCLELGVALEEDPWLLLRTHLPRR